MAWRALNSARAARSQLVLIERFSVVVKQKKECYEHVGLTDFEADHFEWNLYYIRIFSVQVDILPVLYYIKTKQQIRQILVSCELASLY
jgi:hypothetical protein